MRVREWRREKGKAGNKESTEGDATNGRHGREEKGGLKKDRFELYGQGVLVSKLVGYGGLALG